MKKLGIVLVILICTVFYSCEKDNELCDYMELEFSGELYLITEIGSNCCYEYSYTGLMYYKNSDNIYVVFLTNTHYKERILLLGINNEDKIKKLNYEI